MPRPVRAAATKKKYAEESDSEDFDPEEDESFDEDEDPDEIPVPGGGNTIRDAVQENTNAGPSSSGGPATAGTSRRKQAFPSNSNIIPFAAPSASAGGAGSSQPLIYQPQGNLQLGMGSQGFNYNDYLQELLRQSGIQLPLNTSQIPGGGVYGTAMQHPFANLFPGMVVGGQLHPLNARTIAQRGGIKNEPMGQMLPVQKNEEAEDQEDEAMGVAETYSDYTPAKLNFGKRHPDSVVETASMASVDLPDITYKLKLPKEVIEKGHLSNLQLEAVVYACQHHEYMLPTNERAGFLIGDGAGVGKGRTIAGIIYENYCLGRKKAIWVSVSTDLKYDSERDLKDIGANIDVVPLNKLKYGKISQSSGIIFSTYSSLIGESSQSGKFNTRLKQLLNWCGPEFDGCIVFDECHRAKNLCAQGSSKPTKTGQAVFDIQKKLPKARVVYASATGASEPRNMAYMTRLGIWGPDTPFPEFMDFVRSVEKRGVGAMEIVAMDMKRRGAYIARQLSFHGVTFNIEEVPLTPDFIKMYDSSVEFWVELLHKFNEAAQLMKIDNLQKKSMWGQFWSSHQRFFKYLCIAAKVPRVVSLAHEARKLGKCVVVGLQSTGEAKTMEQLEKDEGELSDFVSTAKGVLQSLVEKHFPAESSNVTKILEQLKVREKPSIWEELEIIENPDVAAHSSSSSSKRKSSRKAAQKNSAVKRVKLDSDDSDVMISDESEYEASKSGGSSESYMSETSESEGFAPSDEEFDDEDGSRYGKTKKDKTAKKLATRKSGDNVSTDKPSPEVVRSVKEMRKQLLEKIDMLGALPFNALDQLIEELGGPEDVAEMTGRKGRVIQAQDGSISYQSRSEVDVSLETINLTEKQRFMDGEKNFAIISEAASSGISLQSDRRAKNTKKRVHITLELPWSADRAIQQFGRTHRSNQIHPPEYVFLISELAGEQRFASIVAKRLESLGALTHGDRRAGESRDLSKFHIDTKYGREALEKSLKSLTGMGPPYVSQPSEFASMDQFVSEVLGGLTGVGLLMSENGVITLDKESYNMSKFLNRILGMPVKLQNSLFQYFMDTLNYVIKNAKNTGRFDMGILDLGDSGSGALKRLSLHTFYKKHSTGLGKIELHKLLVERGLSWESAMETYSRFTHDADGFYLLKQVKNDKRVAVLVVSEAKPGISIKGASDPDKRLYTLYRPSTGMQFRRETWKELKSKYEKKEPEEVKSSWMNQYEASTRICTHAYWNGRCRTRDAGLVCDIGTRNREYNVLSGSVLMVWTDVESVLNSRSASYKMLVVRVRDEALRLVGVLIPNTCVDLVTTELKAKTERFEIETFTKVKKEALDN